MISERTMRVLEFTRIREMLAEGALTEAGAEQCRALVPMDDLPQVLDAQAETEEATVILHYIGGHPMAAFPDVRRAPSGRDGGKCAGRRNGPPVPAAAAEAAGGLPDPADERAAHRMDRPEGHPESAD